MGKKNHIGTCFALAGGLVLGALAGGKLVKRVWLDKYCNQKRELSSSNEESDLLYRWLQLKEHGVRFSEYFVEKGLHSVAVLGMGREGRLFIDVLAREGEVTPAYGVEMDYLGSVHESLVVYRLGDDPLPEADCLVGCDLVRTEEKMDAARKEFSGESVTLEQVLDWLMEKHNVKRWQGQSTSKRPAK